MCDKFKFCSIFSFMAVEDKIFFLTKDDCSDSSPEFDDEEVVFADDLFKI